MASRRRDRGRRPRGGVPVDIQGTLGTLLRTTLHQVGMVKDVVERQARSSLGQLDTVMLERRRRDALARLGEVVRDLARGGQLAELAGHPDIAGLLGEIDELEERLDEGGSGRAAGVVSSADWTPPAPASRAETGRDRGEPVRVWRPVVPDDTPGGGAAGEDRSAGAPDREPGGRDAESPAPGEAPPRAAERARRRHPRRRGRSTGGGIAFVADDGPGDDDDDDLAAYMHEDDVPPRD